MTPKPDTPTAGRSDASTVSAAVLRLYPLLRKIRDGLSQYLEAFALAIQGATRQEIKWPLFIVEMPDPGDGGTLDVQQEAGDFVGFDNFPIRRFNIPVAEADIDTAASYLRHIGLDPDAQRLLEVFKGLKAAFCSLGDWVALSDGSMMNRKFYAQERALVLSEHLEELIRTLPTILTDDRGHHRPAAKRGSEADVTKPTTTAEKAKRSTERGEGRAKLIAALTKHHKYADGSCLNLESVGNNELARLADVSKASASDFFTQEFGGHTKYKNGYCTDASRLAAALKQLNGEYSADMLFGGTPPSEKEPDDED